MSARASETEKDKRERIERDLPRGNTRDRVERDFKGDRFGNRRKYHSRSEKRRDVREREGGVHERDRETRHRERDRDTRYRERDVHERDVDSARDREYRENHDRRALVDRREQKDKAYHTSREDRERKGDERRKDRSDKRRDHRDDEGRTHEKQNRNDYSYRKDKDRK